MVNPEIFEKFDEKLSRFIDITGETNPKKIVLFFINIIYTFDFWTKEELIKHAKIWFQF